MNIIILHQYLKIAKNNIPNDITKYNNTKLKEFVLLNIKKDYSIGKNTIDWNFIKAIRNLGFITKLSFDNKKAKLIIDDTEVLIKKQNYFHFKCVDHLYKYKNRKYIEDCFYDKKDGGYMTQNIKVEDEVCVAKKDKYYVDFTIKINDIYYLCIEFFEKTTHYNKDDPDFKIDKARALQILDETKFVEKKCVSFHAFWDYDLNDTSDDQIKIFMNKITITMKDYYYLDDIKYWTIQQMNKYIDNQELNEALFDSHCNKNIPQISLVLIEDIIKDILANKTYIEKHNKKFIEYTNGLLTKNISDDIINLISDSDDEYDNDNNNNELIYYDPITKKLSWFGLHIYLMTIPVSKCSSSKAHYTIVNLYERMSGGFIDGLKEQYNKLKLLSDNRIHGF